MDINLEKIELVKDRTGSTYAEAKEALERADGSVVDAIIYIEDRINKEFDDMSGNGFKDSPVFAKIKEIIEKGNIARIIIKKNGTIYVNFPLTVGVLGVVLVPWGVIIGSIAALGTQCDIEFVDHSGKVTDINGKALGMYDKAKHSVIKGIDKAQIAFNKIDKDGETREKIGEYANIATEKIQEYVEKGTEFINEKIGQVDQNGKIDEIKDSIEKTAKNAVETIKNAAKEASEKAKNAKEDIDDEIDDIVDDISEDIHDIVTEMEEEKEKEEK